MLKIVTKYAIGPFYIKHMIFVHRTDQLYIFCLLCIFTHTSASKINTLLVPTGCENTQQLDFVVTLGEVKK